MTGLEKFRQTVQISKFIERNLEPLACFVEGSDQVNVNVTFDILVTDLKKLFPDDNADSLARTIITERCRAEFIKLKEASRPRTSHLD